jgi:hypothetical protein
MSKDKNYVRLLAEYESKKDFDKLLSKSPTAASTAKAISLMGVVNTEAFHYMIGCLCIEIDDLKLEIHRIKSRAGMKK